MSLRVHMSSPFVSQPYSSHARLVDVREFDRRPLHSPPPITTLDSPSPSVADRSSTTTPHQRRSPPMGQPYYPNQQDLIPSSAPRQAAHFSSRAENISQHQQPPYPVYPFDHRYEHHPHDRYLPPQLPTHFVQQMHEPYGRQQYPPQAGQPPPVTIVHTDDAATKLTDGIRRRCFNCCTTDTSTWRRSNLSPGKVLCNKCGLFERTHSRPRPDQFPHKRGPLAGSTLRGRTPPGIGAHGAPSGTQLPPIVGSYQQYHHGPPLAEYPQQQQQQQQQQQPLPGLQSWHNTSGSSAAPSNPPDGGGAGSNGGTSASTSAHGTPLLPSRRPTMDGSPRAAPAPAPSANGAPRARYDDGLASNAAAKEEADTPAAVPRAAAVPTKPEGTPERD
ncbi:hypothetical protein HYPSUDRAFT_206504 [Hypholoma sublateritium FD-334 SS-4]|uniref:GATA-type domain-containing protein n=1 Tax=Hypholoma sublateritium (strain FD-334 SS-4) TaxID=945553 RepID=A0A0D2KQY4_HYPSF|nr:hypothetical protein HYPSUDRAFT_206504 [Hypholoma sublateritium FD-334 SS-4]